MKIKQLLNTAWLVLFTSGALTLVRCAREDSKSVSDKNAVTQAKDNLKIGYVGGDSMSRVTTYITLPTTGTGNNGEGNGVVISWISSNSDIIAISEIDDADGNLIGTVNRLRGMDTEVTLTATLTKRNASDTKLFTLTIIITDVGALKNAIRNLAIGYGAGDDAGYVRGDITLPVEWDGVTISWAAEPTGIVSTAEATLGEVTRPHDMDAEVLLTATLTRGGVSNTKTFPPLTVITSVDGQAVKDALPSLAIGYDTGDDVDHVRGDITLPIEWDGVTISWAAEPTGIVSTAEATLGEVTQPNDMNAMVTLTATLTRGGASDTKTFPPFTVIISENAQSIKDAMPALMIGYTGDDNATGVTRDLTLPTAGTGGVAVGWMSSHSDIIAISGTDGEDENLIGMITRPEVANAQVTLTATLTKGEGTEMASDTKEFMLIVLAPPATNAIAVMRAKDRLGITYSSGDSDTGVKTDLTLLTEGVDGVSISWAAEPTGIVSTAEATLGELTRPGNMDTVVTLTATLTKGTEMEMASDTKEFTLTVLQDDPKLINIESVAQLIAMRYDPDGNGMVTGTNQSAYEAAFPGLDTTVAWEGYELMADLDLDPELPGGSNWTPQSNISTNFEGNGYTISNMTISVSGQKRSFFSDIGSGGHVRNLNLRDVSVNGHQRNGGLAGKNSGTITSCSTTGGMTTTGWFNGGLVGENEGTITASYSEVAITGRTATGGLVGYNRGTITASYATGDVTGGGTSTGGLVGDNRDTITASYATGDVTATATHASDRHRHGGLVGINDGTEAVIKASYATGNVSAGSQNEVGGLVGKNTGTITVSYSTGTPTSTGSDIGGLVGDDEGSVTESYFDSTTSGIITGEQAKTTSELQMPEDYGIGIAIYSAWNIDVDNGFARGVDNGSAAGDNIQDDPWDFGTSSQYPALKVDFDGDGTAGVAEFGSQR